MVLVVTILAVLHWTRQCPCPALNIDVTEHRRRIKTEEKAKVVADALSSKDDLNQQFWEHINFAIGWWFGMM